MQQQISLLLRLPQSESVHNGHFLKLLRYHLSRVELSYYGNTFRQQSALQFTRCMPDYPATSVVLHCGNIRPNNNAYSSLQYTAQKWRTWMVNAPLRSPHRRRSVKMRQRDVAANSRIWLTSRCLSCIEAAC